MLEQPVLIHHGSIELESVTIRGNENWLFLEIDCRSKYPLISRDEEHVGDGSGGWIITWTFTLTADTETIRETDKTEPTTIEIRLPDGWHLFDDRLERLRYCAHAVFVRASGDGFQEPLLFEYDRPRSGATEE